MDEGDDAGFGEDSGDHSPSETMGTSQAPLPKSRAWDGAFFVAAIVVALALLATILFVKG